MLATLERKPSTLLGTQPQPAPEPKLFDEAQELGRAMVHATVTATDITFAVETSGTGAVNLFATPMRMWMLASHRTTGGVAATIAPSFFGETYPAMLALVQSLNVAGMENQWNPDGVRTVRLERARHVFVSADRPVTERSPAPDSLLEVIEAHRVDMNWYAERVVHRSAAAGLTKVFYGQSGITGSLFEHVRAGAVAAEAQDGVRRCFSLVAIVSPERAALSSAIDTHSGTQGESHWFDHNTLLATSDESQRFAA